MVNNLAIDGGTQVRKNKLPYGRQWVDEDDINAVVEILQSDWLTTGPMVGEFEEAFSEYVGSDQAVAVCNGTAALHAAMFAIGIKPGDEVIVPPMTFAASANCVVYQGATPIFVDVDPKTLLLDPTQVEAQISEHTKAIIAVDYSGQPCDYDALRSISDKYNLFLVSDACHAIGGKYKERMVGSIADLSTFSFHPVKHITTGEGGMITTDNENFAEKMRIFRNHGITTDHRQREEKGSWFYEMVDLGYNYRLTDIQCALGLKQLEKLSGWVSRRQEIARIYNNAFADISAIIPLSVRDDVSHAYHLYMVQIDTEKISVGREQVYNALNAEGIGVNVHYIPVHLHPYYRNKYGTKPGLCPNAESVYEKLITLPIFPQMTRKDIEDVITAVKKVIKTYKK